ncbi:MAG: hypothetical protein ACYC06_11715 [Ilumatobacteraceae bacterium]
MALLAILVNIVSVIANYGKTDLSGFAVGSLIASIFAYGIFANFRADPQNAPNYAVLLSTVSGIIGLILMIAGFSQ